MRNTHAKHDTVFKYSINYFYIVIDQSETRYSVEYVIGMGNRMNASAFRDLEVRVMI